MARPGSAVLLVNTPSSVSLPSDTGTAFVIGQTDRGPLTPVLITSLAQFVTVFGTRQSYSSVYDWLDVFFREGGNRCYVSRVVGPAATVGTRNLLDAGAGVSLTVNANGPGAWSANYKVQVLAGGGAGTYQIQITDLANNVLENSGDLADQQSAVNWSQYSNYVRIVLGVTALNPAVAAGAALSAGNDDRGNITDTQRQTALNMFTPDFGPGQVANPGITTSTVWSMLATHAAANNRVALLDAPNIATSGTLIADAALAQSRFAAMFAPWIVVPGLTNGTFRTVPPTALVAGLIAKNDPVIGADAPSAGNNGVSSYAVDVSQPAWDDPTRTALNAGGVDVIRNVYGSVRVYGWRSTVNAQGDPNWIDFGNGRLYMAIDVALKQVAENFVFDDIDGQGGETIGRFHGALAGVMLGFFQAGQLFGDNAEDAFYVDTSADVNTLVTIGNLELHGVVGVKMAPFAEYVEVDVVKLSIAGG